MKKITTNIAVINPELFYKAYSAFIQTYGYAPTTAYLNKDTLNALDDEKEVSVIFEFDPSMLFGEVAFG